MPNPIAEASKTAAEYPLRFAQLNKDFSYGAPFLDHLGNSLRSCNHSGTFPFKALLLACVGAFIFVSGGKEEDKIEGSVRGGREEGEEGVSLAVIPFPSWTDTLSIAWETKSSDTLSEGDTLLVIPFSSDAEG